MTVKTEELNRMLVLQEMGQVEDSASYLADDFKFSGPVPEPLNKNQFVSLMTGLTTALPDWRFNHVFLEDRGDTVRMKIRVTGTNLGLISLPQLGLASLAPTRKRVALPDEPVEIVFRNEKIISIKITPVDGGGIRGLFDQLGIELPAPAMAR